MLCVSPGLIFVTAKSFSLMLSRSNPMESGLSLKVRTGAWRGSGSVAKNLTDSKPLVSEELTALDEHD